MFLLQRLGQLASPQWVMVSTTGRDALHAAFPRRIGCDDGDCCWLHRPRAYLWLDVVTQQYIWMEDTEREMWGDFPILSKCQLRVKMQTEERAVIPLYFIKQLLQRQIFIFNLPVYQMKCVFAFAQVAMRSKIHLICTAHLASLYSLMIYTWQNAISLIQTF